MACVDEFEKRASVDGVAKPTRSGAWSGAWRKTRGGTRGGTRGKTRSSEHRRRFLGVGGVCLCMFDLE